MKEKTLFKGKIFDVIQKEVSVNGYSVSRDIVVHSGGAALICFENDKILLVNQSRAGVNAQTIEIPAGMVEKGETPLVTAQRELNEETGYKCQSMKLISAFWPTPGYDSETIWMYRCYNCKPVLNPLLKDFDEDI